MMRARESCSAATRAVITGSGLALRSARATAACSATSPRTASRNSSQTARPSGATARPSHTVSTVRKPMSTPSGTAQPHAAAVTSPTAVALRHTTTVNETRPSGISSRR